MILTLLKAKLHRATITRADLDYEGSITIDANLLEKSGILPHEQVDVLDITNGARLTTYAIPGPRNSGEIGINGAAAHLVKPGDLVIICAYAQMDAQEARNFHPSILLLDEKNRIKHTALKSGHAA
ncbi:MAG: aspartate 1-decarboxylase [Alphaproteobacteria bacterium]|nr:aspartate 1-decarboxylase [Alphaproteobacteria bacterium]MBP7758008.1 aspartate 1-decarboxylase [Alphaproteobacteria bacterium]MBP7761335.1 aspartate 1-decarboxylase [Alphaproteobacteria bacterium]MBP7904881.1 aspartate 1-decarboxylase [Alphaproteobacteria bacterium]